VVHPRLTKVAGRQQRSRQAFSRTHPNSTRQFKDTVATFSPSLNRLQVHRPQPSPPSPPLPSATAPLPSLPPPLSPLPTPPPKAQSTTPHAPQPPRTPRPPHPPHTRPQHRPNLRRRNSRPALPIARRPTIAKTRILTDLQRAQQAHFGLPLDVAHGPVHGEVREAPVPPAVAVGLERDAVAEEARVRRWRDEGGGSDVGAVEALSPGGGRLVFFGGGEGELYERGGGNGGRRRRTARSWVGGEGGIAVVKGVSARKRRRWRREVIVSVRGVMVGGWHCCVWSSL